MGRSPARTEPDGLPLSRRDVTLTLVEPLERAVGRLRDAGKGFWSITAAGFVVGGLIHAASTLLAAPASDRTTVGAVVGAGVVGGLVGFAVLMPAMGLHLGVVFDHPRAARWVAGVGAAVGVVLLSVRFFDRVTWPMTLMGLAFGIATSVLAPWLVFRRRAAATRTGSWSSPRRGRRARGSGGTSGSSRSGSGSSRRRERRGRGRR